MRFVKNEWVKIWSQKNSWIMMGIIIVVVAGLLGLLKYFSDDPSTSEIRLEENNKDIAFYQEQLENPKIAEEDKFIYNENITKIEYRIANDLPSEGAMMSSQVFDQALKVVLVLVSIFTMVLAASVVSSEFGTGTIKMLLTRPANRWKILLSKLISVLLYGLTVFVVCSVVAVIGSYLLFNSGEAFTLYVADGEVVKEVWEYNWLKTIILNGASILMTILFAFMLGTIFGSSSLAISLSLIILFMGSTITFFLSKYEFAKYIWFTNDLAQFADETLLTTSDLTLGFAIVINIVYAIIFLGVSFVYFIRRDITA